MSLESYWTFIIIIAVVSDVCIIVTCVSFSWSAAAISILLALVRYLLKWNSFSSSVNCFVEKFVLPVLLIPPPWPPYPNDPSGLGAENRNYLVSMVWKWFQIFFARMLENKSTLKTTAFDLTNSIKAWWFIMAKSIST